MALKKFLILLASISAVFPKQTLYIDCPEPEELTSCSCRWLFAPVVSCNQIKSQKDLQSNLAVLKEYATKQLTLSGIAVSSVSDDLFEGLYVKQLVLDNFEVRDAPFPLGSTPFSGLEKSLEELEIKNSFNKDKVFSNLKLGHLENLKIASFHDTTIPTIDNECFAEGPKTLKMLLLERTEIKELGDRVFQSLDNLMFITVVGNHLTYVSRSMFPKPAKHLQKMDIQFNKIDYLPSDLFSQMPSLTEINFSDNNIVVLHEDAWSDTLLRLGRLYFDGNPLICNDSLKWVCSSRVDVVVAKCASPVEKKGLTVRQFCNK